ncbi:unnamed protein product [Trichogramma brassicae]|uniref:C2H2-type domain-containing protein n=1 Tax=Trichogramma brassicae TaxID=86971 RepID=A0A6H5INQ5_9HYME|nr:unnamed protein product [Trichogramma brassicae]
MGGNYHPVASAKRWITRLLQPTRYILCFNFLFGKIEYIRYTSSRSSLRNFLQVSAAPFTRRVAGGRREEEKNRACRSRVYRRRRRIEHINTLIAEACAAPLQKFAFVCAARQPRHPFVRVYNLQNGEMCVVARAGLYAGYIVNYLCVNFSSRIVGARNISRKKNEEDPQEEELCAARGSCASLLRSPAASSSSSSRLRFIRMESSDISECAPRSNLKTHNDVVHTGTRYACDICGRQFSQRSNLKAHIDLVHNGVEYTCDTMNIHRDVRGRTASTLVKKIVKSEDTIYNVNQVRKSCSLSSSCSVSLDLSNMNLGPILDKRLLKSPYIEELILRDNVIEKLSPGVFDDLPNLKVLDLSRNKLSAEDMLSFGSHDNLETLIFDYNEPRTDSSNSTPSLDLDEDLVYPNLKNLSLRGISLDLSFEHWNRSFPALERLDLSDNSLEHVQLTGFMGKIQHSVKNLILQNTNLSQLNITEVYYVEELDLSGNNFSDVLYTSDEKESDSYLRFGVISNLLKLNLSNCRIRSIDEEAFKNVYHIVELDLSNNQISFLDDNLLRSFRKLYLSNNPSLRQLKFLQQIPNLDTLALDSMSNKKLVETLDSLDFSQVLDWKVRALSLKDNGLTKLPMKFMNQSSYLEEVDLSDNKLSSFEHWKHFDVLTKLNVRNNLVANFSDTPLDSGIKLEELYVGDNPAREIELQVLTNLPSNCTLSWEHYYNYIRLNGERSQREQNNHASSKPALKIHTMYTIVSDSYLLFLFFPSTEGSCGKSNFHRGRVKKAEKKGIDQPRAIKEKISESVFFFAMVHRIETIIITRGRYTCTARKMDQTRWRANTRAAVVLHRIAVLSTANTVPYVLANGTTLQVTTEFAKILEEMQKENDKTQAYAERVEKENSENREIIKRLEAQMTELVSSTRIGQSRGRHINFRDTFNTHYISSVAGSQPATDQQNRNGTTATNRNEQITPEALSNNTQLATTNTVSRTVSSQLDIGRIVRGWNLKYSGEPGDSIEEFLERVRECRRLTQLTDNDLLNAMSELLTGSARLWARQTQQEWTSWQHFCNEARACFGVDRRFQQALIKEAQRRTQGDLEPVRSYIFALLTIMSKFEDQWPVEMQLDLLHTNMRPDLQMQVRRSSVTTVGQLLELAREAEGIELARRVIRDLHPKNTVSCPN